MIGKNMWCFWTLHIRIVKVRRNTVAPFLYILTVFLKICYWPKTWVGMEREINLCLRIAESSDFCRGRSTRNSWCWVKVKKTYQTTHITQNIWRAVVTLDRAPETWVTFGAFIIHLIDLLITKEGKKVSFLAKKNPVLFFDELFIFLSEKYGEILFHFKRNGHFHTESMSLDIACTQAAKFCPASLRTERMNSVPL